MIVDGQVWFSDVVGNIMKKRAKARKDGFAEGFAEGRAKGLAEGRAEGLAQGRAEGLAEGVMRALWIVLQARGLRPSAAQRARIERCQSCKQLALWVRRAAVANSMSAVLRPSRDHTRATSAHQDRR